MNFSYVSIHSHLSREYFLTNITFEFKGWSDLMDNSAVFIQVLFSCEFCVTNITLKRKEQVLDFFMLNHYCKLLLHQKMGKHGFKEFYLKYKSYLIWRKFSQ